MTKKQNRKGKTEVYPFWFFEDIVNMIKYFEEKEMWHWWWAFHAGLLLGRRVGDTMMLRYSDFFYENGRMKDELEIVEEKTGKIGDPYVCPACKTVLREYIKKTETDLMENYHNFIIPTDQKTFLLKNKDRYTEEEFSEMMKQANNSQCAAYRKQFKMAVKACGITYPCSTHSTRKSFGYWSVKLHPYDLTTVDRLQGIFEHADRNTTLKYIGLAREGEIKLYNDMGNFLEDIKEGRKPIIKNSPVIPLKSEDFRELLSKCWDMAQSGTDKFEGLNELISLAEERMV